MLAASLALRGALGGDPLIDLAAETTLRALPTSVFSLLLETLRSVAKPLLVVGVILGMSLVGGGMAMLQPSLAEPMAARRRAFRFVSMAIGIWLPLALFVLLAEATGPNALTNRWLMRIALSSATDAVIFTGALYLLFPAMRQAVDKQSTRVDSFDSGRRRLLALASLGVVAASAGYLGKLVLDVRSGAIGERRAGIPARVTPVGEFYVVSKNVLDPDVDRAGWALHVRGLVSQPLTLSYADLAGFPVVQQQTTLTCISNKVGGDLISNGDWAGVRLADLLARAGVSPDVRDVALYAADGYTESLPLAVALDPDVLLAIQLDGQPLNRTHGAPARLIVPGKYGIKNVKWIERVELVAGDVKGYWQQRGWTDDATIQTMSRIDVPANRAVVSRGVVAFGGIAYAGDRGVSDVQLSFDGGATWNGADSVEEVAPLSWAIWRSTWNADRPGAYRVLVRAIDGQGQAQTAERRDPIPDGATGYHAIEVGVI